jgi:predicted metal-dependent RNase
LKITFYGGAGEVGRSCIRVDGKETTILLDAGVKLAQQNEMPLLSKEGFGDIDAVVVTHAHLDHCGYLPHMYSQGFTGSVYATKPTLELANVIISDYLRLSKPKDVSKHGTEEMVRHHRFLEYFKSYRIGDFEVKLYPAGHILGSAMVELKDTTTGESLLYTGDFNMRSTRLLDPAYTEHLKADTLITESTYGGDADVFPPQREVLNGFINSIKETILTGGKALIPSFAVGRAQEVLFILNDYMRSGILPQTNIYIDGMINKAMRIYRHNVIYCRDEIQKQILMSEDDPFKSKFFHIVKGRQERGKIASGNEASIVVTTSGMLKGGPIVKYLQRSAGDPNSKLIFVGYQAPDTPGRKILDGERTIELDGKQVKIEMKIEQYRLSAHADRQSLMHMISRIEGLKNVVIVHGEPQKIAEFSKAVDKKYKVYTPSLGSSIEV